MVHVHKVLQNGVWVLPNIGCTEIARKFEDSGSRTSAQVLMLYSMVAERDNYRALNSAVVHGDIRYAMASGKVLGFLLGTEISEEYTPKTIKYKKGSRTVLVVDRVGID